MFETSGTTGTEVYDPFTLKKHHTERITIEIMMDGKSINMEVDTGAAVTIIGRNTFKQHYKAQQEPELRKTSDVLRTYTGQQIHVEGVADVSFETNGQTNTLQLMVVPGDGPSLLGRNWLHEVKLDWSSINRCGLTLIDDLLKKYSNVFDPDGNSPIKGVVAEIHVPVNTKPLYFRAIPLPYALKIPRIDDLYAKLSNGKLFTRLDMRHAYEQLHLDIESRKFVTINTHRGLFTYTRMPYGVSSAPSIFQRVIDAMFQGIPNVLCYLDDILITGSSDEQHMDILDKVLDKLSEAGIHLKQSKCELMKHSVVFLGHKVDSQGVHPAGATLDAIRDARPPTNLTELRSFIGMVNHYARFIRGLSGKLIHLHMLLRKDIKWFWGTNQQQTFVEIKNILSSPPLVVHYDPCKPLMLTTDASEYGVVAVLSHTMEDGTDRPVACFSRTLSPTEKNYSQLDKEGLSIIYGLTKCPQFVYGRHVTIVTDHKPLITLFGEHKPVSQMVSPRIQRWALTLSFDNYTIHYCPGLQIPQADALSRLPLTQTIDNTPIPQETVLFLQMLDTTPATSSLIRQWTRRDPILSKIINMVYHGHDIDGTNLDFKPYQIRQTELSIEEGILLWGSRVVIPPQGRDVLLQELHEGHPGVVRMKALARGLLWWPKLDNDIEQYVKHCDPCQRT